SVARTSLAKVGTPTKVAPAYPRLKTATIRIGTPIAGTRQATASPARMWAKATPPVHASAGRAGIRPYRPAPARYVSAESASAGTTPRTAKKVVAAGGASSRAPFSADDRRALPRRVKLSGNSAGTRDSLAGWVKAARAP